MNHSFKKDDITFTITKVPKIEGHAEVSIRKGKQICVYEYAIDCDFRGETDADECEGSFKVIEINESDLDF